MDIGASNWNEDDNSNSTPSPDGLPEGCAPSGVNNWARATMGAIKRWFNWLSVKTTAGGPTTYTVSYTVAPGALVDGQTNLVQFNTTNGASPTLNVNSLGAIPLHTYTPTIGWAAAPAGALPANAISRVAYHSSSGTYRVLDLRGQTHGSRPTVAGQGSHSPAFPHFIKSSETWCLPTSR